MSKFLNVPNGNYTVTVQTGGQITLDTGGVGLIQVVGDLEVLGETTTIESTISTIRDNLIVVNDGESGDGITGIAGSLGQAGIEADRGTLVNARLVFDENVNFSNPSSGSGAWSFEDANGTFLAVQTNQILTGGSNLNLINAGNGVISVEGTNNYEQNIFVYSGGSINVTGGGSGNGCVDNDYIPNAKGVADYMDAYFASVFQDRIQENDTYVETSDFQTTGLPSYVDIGVDSSSIARFYSNRIELEDVRITDNVISTYSSDSDLVLSAPGTGAVRVNDTLAINSTPGTDDSIIDPSVPSDGLKLYVKAEDTGNTGLFFVNSSNTRDEIISNNRSLVYSMLF